MSNYSIIPTGDDDNAPSSLDIYTRRETKRLSPELITSVSTLVDRTHRGRSTVFAYVDRKRMILIAFPPIVIIILMLIIAGREITVWLFGEGVKLNSPGEVEGRRESHDLLLSVTPTQIEDSESSSPAEIPPTARPVLTVMCSATLREGPSKMAAALRGIPRGTTCEQIGSQNRWYHVRCGPERYEGWIWWYNFDCLNS